MLGGREGGEARMDMECQDGCERLSVGVEVLRWVLKALMGMA